MLNFMGKKGKKEVLNICSNRVKKSNDWKIEREWKIAMYTLYLKQINLTWL